MFDGTTILSVRKKNTLVMISDGQVTLGNVVLKKTANKIRKISHPFNVLCGFAGNTSDAMALFDRFEGKLKEIRNIERACIELSQEWQRDNYSRNLNAMMLVSDKNITLLLDGSGSVIRPDTSIMSIGSGGNFALSAAIALSENENLTAREIALKSMKIASDLCIYTNNNFSIEEIK